jgi:two-component system sensor kinase
LSKFIYYTEIEILLNDDKKKALLKEEITESGEHELEHQSHSIARKFNRASDIELSIQPFNAKISSSHFEIIIANILDNAFKFSNKSDKIKVTVKLDYSRIYINVIDNGIGFDQDKLKEIGAFAQFNRSQMEQQGLGLGLITSQKLINFYEGELNISNNKPKGSTVTLTFLLAE